jgi:acetate kinase
MKILVLNCGSSSIKYKLFRSEDWQALAAGSVSRIGESVGALSCRWTDASGVEHRRDDSLAIPSHRDGIEQIIARLRESGTLANLTELGAIGHRVVHGGEVFHSPTIIDDEVISVIEAMIPLAPLHNPAHLTGIAVARELCPDVPSVSVFDTAFHLTMPRTAYRYALPEYLYKEHRVRRYGFHGTSHQYVAKRAAEMLDKPLLESNLITLHLGNGASATAIRNGHSVDTSMGFTPLEGLVMGTRSGDLDPAILFYLNKALGLTNETLDQLLNRQSGLVGLCGVNDMREIHRLAEAGEERAELAIGVFCHRLVKYLGAYYAVLGRVDAIVFTGGIGENDAAIRARTCAGLERLGIQLDSAANLASVAGERTISASDSLVKVFVIPTDEELEIAQQVHDTIAE